MPLLAPNLDDRRFADIVAEARTLIPRYAPEWTDHNDSDPGVALTKLFAWMTDLTLWRLNQTPEAAYIKFLQMVGIERRPAAASRSEITFTPSRDDIADVPVPMGTQVAAPADDQGPIVFETVRPLTVLGATLAAVQVFDGFGYSVETTKAQADGQWLYPFGPNTNAGSALMLGFASKVALTSGTIEFTVRLASDGAVPQPVRCPDPEESMAPIPPAATLFWECWDLVRWQPLQLIRDDTRAFTADGHILIKGPGPLARLAKLGDVATPLFWIRCRLEASTYERAPRLDTVLINTVPVIQAATYRNEAVGTSNGRPDQSFPLANRPILPAIVQEVVAGAYDRQVTIKSVRLEVDEGEGPLAWQEVDDFFASGLEDPHFVVNRTTGVVTFGNGVHGRVPLAFAPATGVGNVIARQYLSGGGPRGLLPPNTISEIQTFLPGIDSAVNPFAAQGGTDEETVDEAKLRAAAEIKSNCRAVTAEDFETRAREAGVRRAKALPLTHPRFPGSRIPGAVTVIVVPDGDAPNPMPNSTTLAAVCAHLDQFRLATTEVYAVGPIYRLIRVEVDLSVKRTADFAQVRAEVDAQLNRLLHPLTGGSDGQGWPFGGAVFFSDIYRLILDVPDVLRIADGQLVIKIDGEAAPFCRDIPLCPGELVYSTGHEIRLSTTTEGAR